jgi:hypothetical protein
VTVYTWPSPCPTMTGPPNACARAMIFVRTEPEGAACSIRNTPSLPRATAASNTSSTQATLAAVRAAMAASRSAVCCGVSPTHASAPFMLPTKCTAPNVTHCSWNMVFSTKAEWVGSVACDSTGRGVPPVVCAGFG